MKMLMLLVSLGFCGCSVPSLNGMWDVLKLSGIPNIRIGAELEQPPTGKTTLVCQCNCGDAGNGLQGLGADCGRPGTRDSASDGQDEDSGDNSRIPEDVE